MGILERASELLAVPYMEHGRLPDTGWDCWGCSRWVRSEFWGLESPSWSELYTYLDAGSPERIEEIIQSKMAGWSEIELTEGCMMLFRFWNRAAHVGVYLGHGYFIHALRGSGTAIPALVDGRWKSRLIACYERN